MRDPEKFAFLEKYGADGVAALSQFTPRHTGDTAGQWRYEVQKSRDNWKIVWYNDHIENGVNIAIILQYGHGTGTGGYVRGRDYINPAIRPIMDQISENAKKVVNS